jgi:hypothetical protein
VRLWSAAAAQRERLDFPLAPNEQAAYEREIQAAQAQLEPAIFAAIWAAGRLWSLAQAIAYGLDEDSLCGRRLLH